jgi:catechol 2,3-dioxygenase-like lactoylglutathione lyase family enzyme
VKLNHLDLQVTDVPRTVTFFEEAFGFQLQSSRRSSSIAILADSDGFVLVLQRKKSGSERYPEGFHFGFLVDDEDFVRRFHRKAQSLGLEVSEIICDGRGIHVYCKGPDELLAEVSCRGRSTRQSAG